MAALHNFFIVNRAGGLIYSRELTPGSKLAGNELLMLASTFHSLHAISKQLAPVASGGITEVDAPTFSLHCLESPTGVKFFVTARPQTPNVPGFLRKTYELYADYVLKNPFYEIDMPIRVKVRGCLRVSREEVACACRRHANRAPFLPNALRSRRRLRAHPYSPFTLLFAPQLFEHHVEAHARSLGLAAPPRREEAAAAPAAGGGGSTWSN